jgi:hypothetical protein
MLQSAEFIFSFSYLIFLLLFFRQNIGKFTYGWFFLDCCFSAVYEGLKLMEPTARFAKLTSRFAA